MWYTPLDKLVRGVWGFFGLFLCILGFIASIDSPTQPDILVAQQTVEVTRFAVTEVMVTAVLPTNPPWPTSTPILTPTPLPTPLYDEQLLAYFPFARTSIDETGRGFHGQVQGDVYFVENTALFWNGEGQIVWNNLPLEQFTVAFNLYLVPPDTPRELEMYFLGQHQPCIASPAGFQLLYRRNFSEQFILRTGEKQAVASVAYAPNGDGVDSYLTAVFTDKEAKLYVDGELIGISTSPYVPTPAELVLGQQFVSIDSCTPLVIDENNSFFIGINHLVFYDTPLSDEEVSALFGAYLQSIQP